MSKHIQAAGYLCYAWFPRDEARGELVEPDRWPVGWVGEPRFLLLQNAPHGSWGFPKGKRDPSDGSLAETARRELQEEIGLDASRLRHHPSFTAELRYDVPADTYGPGKPPKPTPKVVTVFLAEVLPPQLSTVRRSAEHRALEWAPLPTACERVAAQPDLVRLLQRATAWIADHASAGR